MKKLFLSIGLSFCLSLILSTLGFPEETLTITTYYPSPYGSYNELMLYPHSSPVATCGSVAKGTMYYDSDNNQAYICDGTAWRGSTIETRNSDPASPVAGQIWLRTDL